MDGRTKYSRIVKLINSIEEEVLHLDKLRRIIMMEIGSSPKLVTETLHLMTDFGLIKEIDDFQFQIMKNGHQENPTNAEIDPK